MVITVGRQYGSGGREIGTALANKLGIAIHDACGVWMRSWPMTPEKLLHELGRI